MLPLKNMSRKSIVGLALLVCYAPFGWVLFISENRGLWIKLWPILPGLMLSDLLRLLLNPFRIEIAVWLRMPVVILMTVAFLAVVTILMLRISRWRLLVAVLALAASVLLSLGAYGMYKA